MFTFVCRPCISGQIAVPTRACAVERCGEKSSSVRSRQGRATVLCLKRERHRAGFVSYVQRLFSAAQPVHDELEYIKMRYKSPARSSFRDTTKLYATLTTQSTAYSTMSRGGGTPNYSDDSAERLGSGAPTPQHNPRPGGSPHPSRGSPHPRGSGTRLDAPSGITELPPPTPGQTDILEAPAGDGSYPPPYYPQPVQGGGPPRHPPAGGPVDPRHPHHPPPAQYRFNLSGQTHGVTVI